MRLFRLALTLFTAGVLSASPVLAQTDVTSWHLADERYLEVDGAPYRLSPDGQWLAGPSGQRDTFCVWHVETLDKTFHPGYAPPIAPQSIRWSPDSTAVAFGVHAKVPEMRSDIYVYEVSAGTVTNLTDNEPGSPGDEPDEAWYPHYYYPTWSPDGETLAVIEIREAVDGQESNALVTTPRAGGGRTLVAMLDASVLGRAPTPMYWLRNGDILLSIWDEEQDAPGNGIWRVTPDGEMSQALLTDEDSGVPRPILWSIPNDGSRASFHVLGDDAVYAGETGRTYILVNLETGMATPWEETLGLDTGVTFDEGMAGSGILATAPVFSPDGTSAVFMTERADQSFDIGVMNPDSSVEHLMTIPPYEGKISENATFLAGTGPNLVWADNNTVLALTPYNAVLLTLESR